MPDAPKTIRYGNADCTLITPDPRPIYVTPEGKFIVFVGNVWEERTTLKAAKEVAKGSNHVVDTFHVHVETSRMYRGDDDDDHEEQVRDQQVTGKRETKLLGIRTRGRYSFRPSKTPDVLGGSDYYRNDPDVRAGLVRLLKEQNKKVKAARKALYDAEESRKNAVDKYLKANGELVTPENVFEMIGKHGRERTSE